MRKTLKKKKDFHTSSFVGINKKEKSNANYKTMANLLISNIPKQFIKSNSEQLLFIEFREYVQETNHAAVYFGLRSTSRLWLVSSTPGAWNLTQYTVQYWQNFAKSPKHLSSNKMIWQKIAAYIFSTITNNLLLCSVVTRFCEIFKTVVE